MKKVWSFLCNHYIIFLIYAFIGWIYEVSWYLVFRHEFVNRGVLFGPFLPIYGFGMLILLFILKKFMNKKHLSNNFIYLTISVVTIVTFIFTTFVEYTTPKIYDVGYYLSNYGVALLTTNIIVLLITYLLGKLFDKKIDTTIVLVFLLIWIITTVIEFASHWFIDTYFHVTLWDYTTDFLNINARVNWDASRNFAIGGTILLYFIQPFIDKFLNKTSSKTKSIICIVILIPMIIDFLF